MLSETKTQLLDYTRLRMYFLILVIHFMLDSYDDGYLGCCHSYVRPFLKEVLTTLISQSVSSLVRRYIKVNHPDGTLGCKKQ